MSSASDTALTPMYIVLGILGLIVLVVAVAVVVVLVVVAALREELVIAEHFPTHKLASETTLTLFSVFFLFSLVNVPEV